MNGATNLIAIFITIFKWIIILDVKYYPFWKLSRIRTHTNFVSGYLYPLVDDDLLTGPSELEVESRQFWSCTSDSAPGVWGRSPRKYDNLLFCSKYSNLTD